MRRANSQSHGVRLRLRLTNRMCTSLSILLHGKESYTQPVLCNFFAKCMNEYANARGTGPDDDCMTSHLLKCVQQRYHALWKLDKSNMLHGSYLKI